MPPRGRPPRLLLAEDNDDDAELLRLALRKTGRDIALVRVHDGDECLTYLRRQAQFTAAESVDLVMLDLNMPRMDGREVMTQISASPDLRHVPVIILTTSPAEADIAAAQRLGFHYVVKPSDFTEFTRTLQTITDYWFTVVAPPTQHTQ